jgi:hypothetical protein
MCVRRTLTLLLQSNEAFESFREWDEFETHFLLTLNEDQHNLLGLAGRWAEEKRLQTTGQSSPQISPQLLNQLHQSFQTGPTHNAIKLTDAFGLFIKDKQQNWRTNSDQQQTFEKEIFPLLLEITGDIDTGQLASKHVTKYKSAVLNLPKNRRKMPRYRHLSLTELLELKVPEDAQLSSQTKTKYLNHLKTFLNFLGNNGYADDKLFRPLVNVIKKSTRQSDERSAFTDSDLTKRRSYEMSESDTSDLDSHRSRTFET